MLDVLVYSRDAADAARLRDDDGLLEEHWSYMDAFADSMIARGPTFSADCATVTGSLHVLGLADVDAVEAFVAREPNNRAGVYAEHAVWRFENLLGRTMWEFSPATDEPRYFVIARPQGQERSGGSDRPVPPQRLSADVRDRLILYGGLATLADEEPVGIALAVQAPDRNTVDALLAGEPGLRAFADVDVHAWEFGGRR